MLYIHHITLDTADTRRSYRSEVADEAVAALHDGLALALSDGQPAIPGQLGYTYTAATSAGKCLIVTVWRDLPPRGRVPIVTFGVAAHSRCGAQLWRILHEPRGSLSGARYATAGRRCPPEPWLAVRMELGAALIDPDDLYWIADFERVLAWAWLSRIGGMR